MLETWKVDNNETRKLLFVNLRPLDICRKYRRVAVHIRLYVTSRSGISSPDEVLLCMLTEACNNYYFITLNTY